MRLSRVDSNESWVLNPWTFASFISLSTKPVILCATPISDITLPQCIIVNDDHNWPNQRANYVCSTCRNDEEIPVNWRWSDASTVIYSKTSDLELMALHGLNTLPRFQVPQQNKCIHPTRHNSTFGEVLTGSNPSQRTYKTGMPHKRFWQHIPMFLLGVRRPELNSSISRRGRYPRIATYTNCTYLKRINIKKKNQNQ